MTASEGELVTAALSQMDQTIWDASSPVVLMADPDIGGDIFTGALVSHLNDHSIRNHGIIFSPGGENGILNALAEALSAFFENLELEKFPLSEWPREWKKAVGAEPPIHRFLIIDRFELILEAEDEDQLEFCSMSSKFASESETSVLVVCPRDYPDEFNRLPGFRNLDKEGPAIQQVEIEVEAPPAHHTPSVPPEPAPVKRPFNWRKLGEVLLALTTIATVGLFYEEAVELSMADSYTAPKNNPTAAMKVLPAPMKIALPEDFGDLDMEMNMLPAVKVHRVLNTSVPDRFSALPKNGKYQPRTKIEIPEISPGPPIVGVAVAPQNTAPFEVVELLQAFKNQPDQSASGLRETLRLMKEKDPQRSPENLVGWLSVLQSEDRLFQLRLAEAYAEINDLESTYSWYQKYAEKDASPESSLLLGSAQMFGRGTPVNYKEALENLLRAWRGGEGDAAYLYGIAQLRGLGTNQSDRRAYHTLNAAIELGSHLACREAARMKELGIGSDQNLYWAVHLYEKGAEQGDPYCMLRLHQIYGSGENGLFVADKNKAEIWKQKAEQTREDPIHRLVRSLLMPGEFYTRRVVRFN